MQTCYFQRLKYQIPAFAGMRRFLTTSKHRHFHEGGNPSLNQP